MTDRASALTVTLQSWSGASFFEGSDSGVFARFFLSSPERAGLDRLPMRLWRLNQPRVSLCVGFFSLSLNLIS